MSDWTHDPKVREAREKIVRAMLHGAEDREYSRPFFERDVNLAFVVVKNAVLAAAQPRGGVEPITDEDRSNLKFAAAQLLTYATLVPDFEANTIQRSAERLWDIAWRAATPPAPREERGAEEPPEEDRAYTVDVLLANMDYPVPITLTPRQLRGGYRVESSAGADTKRLDWLQESAAQVLPNLALEDDGFPAWRVYPATDGEPKGGATLRAAIDAAMGTTGDPT